ncbi:hypothetical protein DNI29_23295 [Hymenobacter sediminis]|uniref:hypothetical protein n=1 Tax=Hymenobacter sediminis TaxID=2218621 RepID=UPI000DA644CD|nr:hypothetical protein [Hymenobacter sediminis]RPD43665.1 hypothetical protein DNI29_23295 [Hymenobacter sediminis]
MCPFSAVPSICFENASAVILEEAQGLYLRVIWHSTEWSLSAAQRVMNELLGCMHRTGWGKVIFKQPPLPSFPLAYHTWLLYDWLPRAQAAGGWCYALIPPRQLFAHVGFADFLCQVRRREVRFCVASSREQAREWICQQQPTG